MYATVLVLAFSVPAHAGVATAISRVSLQTALTPTAVPTLGAPFARVLDSSLTIPSGLIPQLPPAALPVAAVAAPEDARAPASHASPAEEDPQSGANLFDGLSFKGGKWRHDGRVLSRIARGSIGFVDVHPTRSDLVMKTIDPTFDQFLGGLTMAEAIELDEKPAAALAAAGIGPRILGGATIDGRRVTVRERIFGKTMRELIENRTFGAEEEALVLDMVRRMAEKNLLVSDLKPDNIMLGAAERGGVRRAWLVDGGLMETFEPGLDEAARAQKLLDYPNVVGTWEDRNARRVIETVRTLRFYIQDGREDSEASSWRLFGKRLLKYFLAAGLGAANK